MAEEEEGARDGHAIDLTLMDEEEEGARDGHAIDLTLVDEEEEGAPEGHAMDTNLMAEEEEEAREEEADAQGNPKKKELSDNERFGVYFSLRVIELRDGEVHLYDKVLITMLMNPANKIVRLQYCISMMDEHSISAPYPSFRSMNNLVHIDEKWYDMTRVKNTYYVLPGEPEPERTVSNTSSIGKVMFLTAVAKPRCNDEGQMTFDGKIGTWAFVVETEAQRSSQNRDRGAVEVKPVKVTRHVCRE
ncbi:transposase [Hordeum vulgare]|nr:transposase [Hordeum vulgare]